MSAPRALCEHPTPYIVIFSCFSAAYTHLESYNMSPMIPLFWKLLTFYFRLTYFMQLGGMNSFLLTEFEHSIPLFSKIPTLVIGMDVSHGSQGQSEALSIAAIWYNFRFSCHYILSVILTISTQCLPNIFNHILHLHMVYYSGCELKMLASNLSLQSCSPHSVVKSRDRSVSIQACF